MDSHYKSPSNARKRRRPALSCEQCRRRKVRCDREMPCGPCTKSHDPLDCEYVNEGKVAIDARLERPNEQESAQNSSVSQAGSTSTDGARIAQLERTVQALQGRVRDLEQSGQREAPRGGREQSHACGDHFPKLAHQLRDDSSYKPGQPKTTIPPLNPRLNSTPESLKLFGTTHWALVFQQVSYAHFFFPLYLSCYG